MQKKRKAQEAFVEAKPRLSAFAAAKARAAQLKSEASSSEASVVADTKNDSLPDPAALPTLLSSFPLSSAHEAASDGDGHANGAGYSSDDQIWTETSVAKSYRAVQPRQLSSYRPNKSNVLSDTPSRFVFKLKADENATFVGEYLLQAISGIVIVSGAVLRAGDKPRRVFAPSTHALPTLVAKGGAAEVAIISTGTSMVGLSNLSPLWGKIWTARDPKEGDTNDTSKTGRSFMLLRSSSDDPLKRALTALELEQDIQASLSRIITDPQKPSVPVVLVSGPKASGKSTVSRWLANTYLTSISPVSRAIPASGATNSPRKTCFWLDLDPGQPEFSAPGQVSLVQLGAPILGPPFTHSSLHPSSSHRLIRSHTLASITPKEDSGHFLACAMDLLSHYQRLRLSFPQAPLIINCSGWVLGSAVEVLMRLVRGFPVTDVVLMQPMDMEVVQMIEHALHSHGRVLLIPQRDTKPTQSRTSAEFRSMMLMSYLHSSPSPSLAGKIEEAAEVAEWDTRPLSHIRPWQVSYASSSPNHRSGILGILSYGETVHPDFLSTVLDGMIVAICVIEDMNACFPSLLSPSGTQKEDEDEDDDMLPDQMKPMEALTATTPDDLPYFCPDKNSGGIMHPLDPRFSRCVGLALIRGIDRVNHELHLLTPVSSAEIAEISGHDDNNDEEGGGGGGGGDEEQKTSRIVLVRGKFDSPDWAFLEDVHAGTRFEGIEEQVQEYQASQGGHGVGQRKRRKRAPYVAEKTRVDTTQSRGAPLGGNVWRVRHLPRKMGGAPK